MSVISLIVDICKRGLIVKTACHTKPVTRSYSRIQRIGPMSIVKVSTERCSWHNKSWQI